MEKELFRILQELKIDINNIENMDYNEKIRNLTASECSMKIMYVSLEEGFKLIKKQYKLLSILTLGIFYLKHKDDFEYTKDTVDAMLSTLKNNFDSVKKSKIYYKLEKDINDSKLEVYKTNYDQIDNFINLTKKLNEEEKAKYLTYKIN